MARLRGLGWSLRRIGRDPRVRLSAQAVADVLARQDRAAPRSGDDLVLRWYQRGVVDDDPTAKLWWETYRARMNQLMTAEAERLGVALDDLDVTAREALRREAGSRAEAELARLRE
ncbi:hypothetical protein MINTM019_33440 [Mycobacterium paraintracellulare]|nr:hypothetical protein MINTM019_33440 [Mycobacterium paraintracellulare]